MILKLLLFGRDYRVEWEKIRKETKNKENQKYQEKLEKLASGDVKGILILNLFD